MRKRRREILESSFALKVALSLLLPLWSATWLRWSYPGSAGILKVRANQHYAAALDTPFKNASRSALIVSASVVGMPCGKPL